MVPMLTDAKPPDAHAELERELAGLRYRDHVCMIYENRAEQMAAAVPYMRRGLAAGDRCVYAADDRSVDEIADALQCAGVDVDRECDRGSLLLLTKQDSYLRSGRFDPQEMVDFLGRTIDQALADGFSGLRATGEMTWALGTEPGCDRLIEYEALLDQFFPRARLIGLCQYNRRLFPPAVIQDVLRTHPHAILGGRLCSNPFYEPPEYILSGGHEAERVDWMITHIKERRRADEQLQRSAAEWERTFDAWRDHVCILDRSGRIVRANEAMRQRFEPEHGDLVGLDYRLVYCGTEAPDPPPPCSAVLSGSPSLTEETRLPTMRGWQLVSSYPLHDEEGDVVGAVSVVRDITGEKEAEEALRDSERRLKELNESLEQKVAARTETLRRRTAQLRLLAKELSETEQRERKALAQTLHDGLQQLVVAAKMQVGMCRKRASDPGLRPLLAEVERLLADTVQASRSLAVELSPPVLHDSGLAEALHWLARHFAERHKFEAHVDAARPFPRMTEEIEFFVFHAARELLFNAVKHAGVRSSQVRLRRRDGEILLEVCDEGRGFNVEQVLKESEELEGFGLVSLRERVQALGGQLTISSSPGQGARFLVCVPSAPGGSAAEQEEPDAAETHQTFEGERPIRILVVDDHKIVREGLVAMLRQHEEFRVLGEASDGQEAVQWTETCRPDVVIMDVSMPRVNGLEATRQIKEKHPQVEIVGLSLHEPEDMAHAMRQAGASAYLPKDGPSENLFETIHMVTRGGAVGR